MSVVARTPLPIFCVLVQLGCTREVAEETPHSEQEFMAGSDLPPTPHGVDVTCHLARFRFGGEQRVRGAAERLEGHLRRPWTVERLAAFCAATLDAEQRAAAVTLLAASRDPMGLRVVGNALDDREPRVRVSAAWGIVLYWIGEMHGGENAESVLSDAQEWWQNREATLR